MRTILLCAAVGFWVFRAYSPVAAELPGNGHIVYERREGTTYDVWYIRSDGSGNRKLADANGSSEHRPNPTWRPDGSKVAYVSGGSTWIVDPDGSGKYRLSDHEVIQWWGNDTLLCINDDHDVCMVSLKDGTDSCLAKKSDFKKLGGKKFHPGGLTADGRWLVAYSDRYRGGYTGDNGRFDAHHCAAVFDMRDKDKIYFFGNGCEPTVSPAGEYIYHVSANIKGPSPARMKITGLDRSGYEAEIAYDDADWGHEYFPRISTDGAWMTYCATTGCHSHDDCTYQIFVHRLQSAGGTAANRERIVNDTTVNHRWPHLFVGDLPADGSTGIDFRPAAAFPRADRGAAGTPDIKIRTAIAGPYGILVMDPRGCRLRQAETSPFPGRAAPGIRGIRVVIPRGRTGGPR